MRFAVIIEQGKERTALIKTGYFPRAQAVQILAELHMATVLPGAVVSFSSNLRANQAVPIHPERDRLLDRLRAAEWPLPVAEETLEGSYSVVK